jgi:hypothetical protein
MNLEKGIVIYWDECQEFISFDCDNLESIELVEESDEMWDSGEKFRYNIKPKIIERGSTQVTVEIKYEKQKNHHILSEEPAWGKSHIVLDTTSNSGEAIWFDDLNIKNNYKRRWVRLDSPLRGKERRKITTTKLEREQARFRSLILKLDNACVLSGEVVESVLEAAHIISVSDGGVDIPINGFILRSDIHKLYDDGAFHINSDGKVEINDRYELSNNYLEFLKDAKIPDSTLRRVQRALSEKP